MELPHIDLQRNLYQI